MLEFLKDAHARAGEHTAEWQQALGIDDHLLMIDRRSWLTIYGEVIEGVDPADPARRLYRFARCFSVDCPEGEYGDIHVSSIQRVITAEEFEQAGRRGWVPD
jgi:hypothetical protein